MPPSNSHPPHEPSGSEPDKGKKDHNKDRNPARTVKRRSTIVGVLVGIVTLAVFVVPFFVSFYTDRQWFGAVEYQGVFYRMIGVRAALFFIFGLISAAIVGVACLAAYRSAPDELSLMGSSSPMAQQRLALRRGLRPMLFAVPLFAGAVAGMIAQSNWRIAMLFLNGSSFGQTDPQFHKDLGFYAFTLPMLQSIFSTLSIVVAAAFIINAVGHYLFGSITTGNPRLGEKAAVSTPARRQMAVLAGAWMLLKAVGYWFERYGLLNREHDTFTGGSYTDINAVLPAKIVLLVIAVFVAILFFGTIVLRDLRLPAIAVVLMVLSSITLGFGWPTLLEQFSVKPNRAEKERSYIARNIEATRFAYGIGDDVVTYERDWSAKTGDEKKQKDAIAHDEATLSNIRLLDPQVLSPTFTQQQQLRNFYGFSRELSIDRYRVKGKMRDFVVAAREMNPNTLDGNQKDWINRHTVYTHGNGFIAAPAHKVDEVARDVGSARGGYPVYTVADLQSLQTKKQGGELKLDLQQPRIYYGPLIASSPTPNSDYAIVGKTDGGPLEYDTEHSSYTYTGKGGVNISNPFNRLMYAVQFESMNMLLTDRIGDNSKILYERDPRERVHKVAPWLTTDSKTYPVVIDGRIKWIVDGYTTLTDLPYAERTSLKNSTADALNPSGVSQEQLVNDRVSYIRNSVKAVVDSYDGSVELYEFDQKDPVLKAWRGAFPNVVKPKSEISPELMQHLRYPEDMFKVQRELIARYHVSDPGVFFQNDAFWSVPSDPTAPEGRRELAQPPYYVVASDPKTNKPSFQLITPFRGLRREFLSAHMSVSSDPETYGKIYVRVLPTGTQTQGPKQAQDTMMSSDEVARERTLLEGTTDVINGNLLSLPVAGGQVLYVEPVYSKRKDQESAFPKLLRVLVSYNGQVGYAPTISEALSQVGIDSSAATDIEEVDGSVVKPKADGSVEKVGGKSGDSVGKGAGSAASDAAGAAGGAKGAKKSDANSSLPGGGRTGAGGSGAAAQRVREAMDKVKRTRESSSFEEFGRALDELDRAVAELQAGQ